MDIIILIILISTGYWVGSKREKTHYKSIIERELKYQNIPTTTTKSFDSKLPIQKAYLASGSVVISIDYFKRFLTGLRNIFGGEVSAYETLIDRARREAILRLKETATDADIIVNLRIETSSIGQSANKNKAIGSVEAMAYATVIKYQNT